LRDLCCFQDVSLPCGVSSPQGTRRASLGPEHQSFEEVEEEEELEEEEEEDRDAEAEVKEGSETKEERKLKKVYTR